MRSNRVGYGTFSSIPAARTVRFARPGIELDPGGIGKGYAVDRMVEVLKRAGVRIALVSASGSSIYGLGAPPDEPQGWPITIRDPAGSVRRRHASRPRRTCRSPRPAATRSSSGPTAEPTRTSSTRGPATPRRGRRPFRSSRHGRSTARPGRSRSSSTAAPGRRRTSLPGSGCSSVRIARRRRAGGYREPGMTRRPTGHAQASARQAPRVGSDRLRPCQAGREAGQMRNPRSVTPLKDPTSRHFPGS